MQNQQVNLFYENTKNKLKNTEINAILTGIISNNYKKLDKNEFELLGAIAYIYGFDFFQQKENFSKLTVSNWKLRMDDCEVSNETLELFETIMKNIDVILIEETKDKLKDLLIQDCNFSAETITELQKNINHIFRSSYFPIAYSLEIDDLLKLKKYNYADLLKINKFIYENLELPGSIFANLSALHTNQNFAESLAKGADYYELQKFAVVFFDSMLTAKEFFETTELSDYKKFLTFPELIEEIQEKTETENVVENIETPEQTPVPIFSPDDTDFCLKAIYVEKLGIELSDIKSQDVLLKAIESIVNDEELVQYIYQYLKAKQTLNRTNFLEVFGFELEPVITELKNIYTSVTDKYKKLVEGYAAEFEPEQKTKIVTYVNDVIGDVIINNHERKAYLFQQINENQIHTYKQLQQIIGLIEECNIKGNNINSYISLRNYIDINTKITDVFDSIGDLDQIQIELSFYKAVLDFYTVPEIK